jgi:hypothetical protein
MSVLSAIQNAAAVIALNRPAVLFSSAEREHFELQVLANTCANLIARDHEWRVLKAVAEILGDGATRKFALPSDYDRMLKEGHLWSDRAAGPLTHVISSDKWLGQEVHGISGQAWTLLGNEIVLRQAPVNGETISYHYMSTKWAADSEGLSKTSFASDDDSFRLSESLLERCMIWKWRAGKGLPYAQDRENYEEEKEKRIASDKGARLLRITSRSRRRGIDIACPAVAIS